MQKKDNNDIVYSALNVETLILNNSKETVNSVNNYLSRRCLEEVFDFNRGININEYFVVVGTALLNKLNVNLDITFDVLEVNKIVLITSDDSYSWSCVKGKSRRSIFLCNFSMDVLGSCLDVFKYLFSNETVFDKYYLASHDFIRNFQTIVNNENENQNDLGIPTIEANEFTDFFKISRILLLDFRSLYLHNTMEYCSQLAGTGVIISNISLTLKCIK